MNERKVNEALKNVREYGWRVVDLRNCGLTSIPSELFNHKDIVTIDLSNYDNIDNNKKNRIKEIPKKIEKIENLVRLNLENNEVNTISESISDLKNLKYLNLKNNKLVDFPEKIANMIGLTDLYLDGNPFNLIPPEIVARGIEPLRNFFKELKEKDYIYEVKLLIVGEGRVGKTCLSKALIDDNYSLENQESTEGININSWIIPKNEIKKINNSIERDFQINIWDFGGQEIYHSTHQFFLTKRSLYLLVTESRKEDSRDDFFYWLNIINLLGKNSPVNMVLNKADQPTKELPIKEYQQKFKNIASFNKISLKENYRKEFIKFKKELIKNATKLPHIGSPLPKVWVDIRIKLEELKKEGYNYISKKKYLEICREYYRDEKSALDLSSYFNDLGVIIHFQDDIDLRDLVVLNHEWITKGVYKVLDDQKVIENKGKISIKDVERIWSEEIYKDKQKELLHLMKNNKFDLCFNVDDNNFIIPRLLPVDEVNHSWVSKPENMKFEFRYKFMPKGILARLIVKLNKDIKDNLFWRYGVILNDENCSALVKEHYFNNKITIELKGDNKREYLFFIRKAIVHINESFNELIVNEYIPCNCEKCRSSIKPHFYDYSLLKKYEYNNINNIRCENSLDEVSVYELTSHIIKKNLNEEIYIMCENTNTNIYEQLNLKKVNFYPATDSSDVFIKIKNSQEYYGIRDRDFLLDSEINILKKRFNNYIILDYYCIENYLYHPENIDQLNLNNFVKEDYIKDIIEQKNDKRDIIISNFKKARDSYVEFKLDKPKIRNKDEESKIIEHLNSDKIELFFKYFSFKKYYNKKYIEKYLLKQQELAKTEWFRKKISKLIFEIVK